MGGLWLKVFSFLGLGQILTASECIEKYFSDHHFYLNETPTTALDAKVRCPKGYRLAEYLNMRELETMREYVRSSWNYLQPTYKHVLIGGYKGKDNQVQWYSGYKYNLTITEHIQFNGEDDKYLSVVRKNDEFKLAFSANGKKSAFLCEQVVRYSEDKVYALNTELHQAKHSKSNCPPGYQLLSIKTEQQNSIVIAFLKEINPGRDVVIGGHKENDVWKWYSEYPFQYDPTEHANTWMNDGISNKYLVYNQSSYKFQDIPGNWKRPCLCEKVIKFSEDEFYALNTERKSPTECVKKSCPSGYQLAEIYTKDQFKKAQQFLNGSDIPRDDFVVIGGHKSHDNWKWYSGYSFIFSDDHKDIWKQDNITTDYLAFEMKGNMLWNDIENKKFPSLCQKVIRFCEDKYFALKYELKSPKDCKSSCPSGYRLAEIFNVKKFNLVKTFLTSLDLHPDYDVAVGAHKQGEAWSWYSGYSFNINNTQKPDFWKKDGFTSSYLAFEPKSGKLNDIPEDYKVPYLCEREIYYSQDMFYALNTKLTSPKEAKSNSCPDGYRLAEMYSNDELQAAINFLNSTTLHTDYAVLIGATKSKIDGELEWYSGRPFELTGIPFWQQSHDNYLSIYPRYSYKLAKIPESWQVSCLCERTQIFSHDNWYMLDTESINGYVARNKCPSCYGLALIPNMEDFNTVKTFFNNSGWRSKVPAYIGMWKKYTSWKSVFGDNINPKYLIENSIWADNNLTDDGDKRCVIIDPSKGYKLINTECNREFSRVCKLRP